LLKNNSIDKPREKPRAEAFTLVETVKLIKEEKKTGQEKKGKGDDRNWQQRTKSDDRGI